jgi:nucleotide-binding universal stress UspA family protein
MPERPPTTLAAMSNPSDPMAATPEVRRILLATDLSPTTDLATDWAFVLARRNDAALLVVSVIDTRELRLPGGRFRTRVDQVREGREAAAGLLVERGHAIGVPVTFLVWTGDPGESIVAAAEAEDVDLVLVGAHGRGAIGRLVMGSVSEHVARHAPCPVLIVRSPAPAHAAEARAG